MKFAYKVVRKDPRTDDWISAFGLKIPKEIRIIYKKGIVETPKGTLGIFCFKKLSEAEHFKYCVSENDCKIIKVKPLSRGKVPKHIACVHSVGEVKRFYRNIKQYGKIKYNIKIESSLLIWENPLPGTICYQKIEVVEEI